MKIIILHDADARIEYLDVADHLIGSDIEEFLTRQGFSVNNITWLVTSADHIPVVYHKYDIDRKTGVLHSYLNTDGTLLGSIEARQLPGKPTEKITQRIVAENHGESPEEKR